MRKNRQRFPTSAILLNDRRRIKVDNGVKSLAYFCQRKPVRVERALIERLKRTACGLKGRNLRLCLHESPQAKAHDMIIFEKKGKYYPPHKHLTKGEFFHIIEGRMAVFAFNKRGGIIDACILSPKKNFAYRVRENMFHAVMPLSGLVIYHESKPGPFLGKRDSIYPSWAPDADRPQEINKYRKKLLSALKKD